jgi:surfeit locus 1 family protein
LITARLGLWQLERAGEKQALAEQIESRSRLPPLDAAGLPARTASPEVLAALHSRIGHIAGSWLPGSTVFLDNRQLNGRPGFFVITALQLEGRQDMLLVQRGWVARDVTDRLKVPEVPTPSGRVLVTGRIAPPPARLYDFGGDEQGAVRQNIDVDQRSAELGVRLLRLSLLQTAPSGPATSDDMQRDWPAPAVGIHKHHGYAFQWFALSALTAGLYVWFQVLRPRRRR